MGCQLCLTRNTLSRSSSTLAINRLRKSLNDIQQCKQSTDFVVLQELKKIDHVIKTYQDPYDRISLNKSKLTFDQLYETIKLDINKKSKHLFREIISVYYTFFIQFFQIQFPDDKDISEKESISGKNSFFTVQKSCEQSQEDSFYKKFTSLNEISILQISQETRSIRTGIIQQIKKKLLMNEKLPQLVLESVDYLFKLLRNILQQYYRQLIDESFEDDFLKKEQTLSRIIQQYILNRKSPFHFLLNPAIQIYYQSSKFKGQTVEPPLSQSLLPLKQAAKSILLSNSQFSSGLLTIIEEDEDPLNRIELIQAIQRSESTIKVPYGQTFVILRRIMRTNKFWKKLEFLERLDEMIVSIYLFQRSESQKRKLYDTISAEDSKSEILLFILYKFCQTVPKSSIEKDLYMPMKFMQEFDGIVHKDIKYIYTQSFIRFFSLLELLLQSEI